MRPTPGAPVISPVREVITNLKCGREGIKATQEAFVHRLAAAIREEKDRRLQQCGLICTDAQIGVPSNLRLFFAPRLLALHGMLILLLQHGHGLGTGPMARRSPKECRKVSAEHGALFQEVRPRGVITIGLTVFDDQLG
jgi:hypothetical protein